MEQNTAISLNLTDSLDELLILKFWKITETGNALLLDREYSPAKQYTDEDKTQADILWLRLYDEYYEQCSDGKSRNELNKDNEEKRLSLRYNNLNTLLNMLANLEISRQLMSDEDYARLFSETIELIYKAEPSLKGKLNQFETATYNIDKCKKLIKSIEGQYNRIIDDKPKRIEKAVKKVHNVFERVAQLGAAIPMQLNVHNMCVNEWLGYEKMVKLRNKPTK